MGIANFKMLNSVRGRIMTPECECVGVGRFSHHRRNDGGICDRNGLDWRRLGESWSS